MGRASHLMTDTITVQPLSGTTNWGDPSFGTARTQKARVEFVFNILRDSEGNERQSNARVATETEIGLHDRVFFPGDDTSDVEDARKVIQTETASTPDGYTLYQVFF